MSGSKVSLEVKLPSYVCGAGEEPYKLIPPNIVLYWCTLIPYPRANVLMCYDGTILRLSNICIKCLLNYQSSPKTCGKQIHTEYFLMGWFSVVESVPSTLVLPYFKQAIQVKWCRIMEPWMKPKETGCSLIYLLASLNKMSNPYLPCI